MGTQTNTTQSLTTTVAVALAALPALLSTIIFWWLINSGKWSLFGISTLDSTTGEKTGFGDLAFITATADCYATESGANLIDLDSCDPYGRPFSPYGIIPGRFLALFNLGFEHNTILGIALAATWVSLIFWLTLKVTLHWNASAVELVAAIILITFFSVSPTAMLAVERGTLDILVAALAALGLMGFAASGALRHSASAFLLFIAVIIKYFAVGVFAPFFAPRRLSLIAIISAATTLVFLLLNFDNLRSAQEIAQADTLSTTRIMFSSTTGIITHLVQDPNAYFPPADQVLNSAAIHFTAIALFALLVAALVVQLARTMPSSSVPGVSWFLIVGGSFAVSIPYFMGPSNDYRLVLLLLPLTGVLVWTGQPVPRSVRITLWVIAATTVLSGLTGAAMQVNEFGFIAPKALIIAGDAALATSLAFGVALFVHAWLPRKWTAA